MDSIPAWNGFERCINHQAPGRHKRLRRHEMEEEMRRRLEDRRIPIGKYGSGTLWFERSQKVEFILFDAVKIAELRQPGTPSEGTWISPEPGWKATEPSGPAEIWVQHKGSEGVVIPVRWGRR